MPKLAEKKESKGKQVGPRLTAQATEFYEGYFETANEGASFVLEAFPVLYRRTLSEMKGCFDQSELSCILDVFNGLLWALNPNLLGQHLIMEVSDGISMNGLDQKWKVDGDDFLNRLMGLSFAQKCCLEIWAANFWEKDRHEGETAVEDWCRPML